MNQAKELVTNDYKGQKFNEDWVNKKSTLYKPWIQKADARFEITYCKCSWCEKISNAQTCMVRMDTIILRNT